MKARKQAIKRPAAPCHPEERNDEGSPRIGPHLPPYSQLQIPRYARNDTGRGARMTRKGGVIPLGHGHSRCHPDERSDEGSLDDGKPFHHVFNGICFFGLFTAKSHANTPDKLLTVIKRSRSHALPPGPGGRACRQIFLTFCRSIPATWSCRGPESRTVAHSFRQTGCRRPETPPRDRRGTAG